MGKKTSRSLLNKTTTTKEKFFLLQLEARQIRVRYRILLYGSFSLNERSVYKTCSSTKSDFFINSRCSQGITTVTQLERMLFIKEFWRGGYDLWE